MAGIFPAREARIKRRVRAGIGGVARPLPGALFSRCRCQTPEGRGEVTGKQTARGQPFSARPSGWIASSGPSAPSAARASANLHPLKSSVYESAKRSRNSSNTRPAARCAWIDASKPAIASGILPRARSMRALADGENLDGGIRAGHKRVAIGRAAGIGSVAG
ncbi:hypothetical protein BE17_30150 [Sorangium cellulosum]|uniref:Uncharacterized protein n=1 Tax=Sorangium cellulosum TaxID=56 RepID=A0A150S795_SORCE|nr:hypothetical protein BE17_30150 [Sorangium cellulosum]